MSKRDIYREITDKIVSVLDEVNLDDFEAPFAAMAAQGLPFNPVTDHHYQGINIASLWIDQQEKEFTSPQWATFKQWKEKGAIVRKGETGSPIIFYKTWNKTGENDQGETEEQAIPVLRFYSVFNADQVEGYDHGETVHKPECDLVTRIKKADIFCAKSGADIRQNEERAYYNRVDDYINMPPTSIFVDTASSNASVNYYAVLLHELTHWTGAPHRLDRDKAKTSTERDKYAFEELVAELGAAFLCAKLGISQTPREDHALYIKSWLAALKNDTRFVFKAAAQAGKAAEYLQNLQTQGRATS